jgi:single-strand selective monofunctional uracil DNA glycosylase
MLDFHAIIDSLLNDLRPLKFGPPVTHVYNPLEYARQSYETYLSQYANTRKEVLFIGMNPGPWGMVQTGVPFGEIQAVKEWLGIEAPVIPPSNVHPKRPVLGFDCKRSEMSGKRLWGWAKETFETPERFFSRFFVANYCPLMFIDADGKNRTPDKLRKAERKPLFDACDRSLRKMVNGLNADYVVGIGRFAHTRALAALEGLDMTIGRVTHPSPANPKANRNWNNRIIEELAALGIHV